MPPLSVPTAIPARIAGPPMPAGGPTPYAQTNFFPSLAPNFGPELNPDAQYLDQRDPYRRNRANPPYYGGLGGFASPLSPNLQGNTQLSGALNLPLSGGSSQQILLGSWRAYIQYSSEGGLDGSVFQRPVFSGFLGISIPGNSSQRPSVSTKAANPNIPGALTDWVIRDFAGNLITEQSSYQGNPITAITFQFVPNGGQGSQLSDPHAARRKSILSPFFLSPGANPTNRSAPSPVRAPARAPAIPGSVPFPPLPPVPFLVPPVPASPRSPQFPGARPIGPAAPALAGQNRINRGVALRPGAPAPAAPGSPGGNPIRNGAPVPSAQPQPQPAQTTNYNCKADPCLTNIQATQASQDKKLDRLLQGIGAGGSIIEIPLLAVIDAKLGPQIPNGGIGGKLQRFAQSTKLDKIWNALTLMVVLHNAAMLSKNLALTLGEVTSTAINLVMVRDDDDQPIDVNQTVGNLADTFFKNVLGEELWTGAKATFNKLNRIVTTASNIVWTVRSIADSSREVANWTAENTGKIGNALKRFRVVPENSYNWMPEQVNHGTALQRRFDRFRDGAENLDDAASSIQGVLSEVQSITQEVGELQENHQRFQQDIQSLTPKSRPDNAPVKASADSSDTVSVSPDIQVSDRDKNGG